MPNSLDSLYSNNPSSSLQGLYTGQTQSVSDYKKAFTPSTHGNEDFNEFDYGLTSETDQERNRSINQGTGRELANGLGRAALKVLPSIIGNVASMADLEDYLNQDKEVGNAVTRYMEELKGGIDKTMPIYGEHDLDALDMGKSEWWTSNFSGLAESAASFALTGAGLGAVVKGLGFLSKIAGASSTVQKAIQAGGGVATAVALNQAEAITSAMSVYDNAFKYQTETLGKSEEEAKQIAADAAAYTVNINRLNLPLNITSTLAFLRTSPMTRQAIQQAGLKSAGMKIMEEGAQEFGEEIINKVAEDEGNRYGKIGKEYNYNLNNTISDVFSAEGLEAGILGALGGIAQTGLSEGLDIATGKSEEQNKLYEKQQASLKQLDLMVGGPSLKSVVKNITAQASLINDINDAQASGDELKVESLKNSLLINQAVNSFDAGTTDKLEELYTTISKTPEQEGEAKYGKGFRENATKAISQIKEWEHSWNKSMQTTPDDVNKKELFINKLQQQSLNDRINDLKQTGLKLNTEILSIKENSPEATELPQELELKNVNNSIGSLQKQLAFVQEQSKSILYPEVKPKQKFTVPKETVDAVNQESAQVKVASTPKSEFETFMDTGNVSPETLNTIAEKIKKGETLSKEELAYHAAKTQEVEDILKNDLQLTEEERAQIQNQAYQDAMDEAYSEEDSKDTSVDMGDLVGISTSKNLKKIGNFSAKNTDVKVGDYLGEDKIIELRYIGTGNRDGQIGVITLLSDNGKKTSYDARKIGGELYREETVPTPQATPENTSQKPIKTENIADKKADIERRRQEDLETTKNIGEDKLKEGRENTKKLVESLKQRYPATSVQGIIIRILEKLIDFSKYSTIIDSDYLNGRNASGQATWFGMIISQETYDGILAGKEFEVHTFIHEFIHGFTTSKISDYNIEKQGLIPGFKSKLTAKEKNAIEQLQRIFEKVKKDNPKSKEYGFTNLDEFIAEAFSNTSFQYTLKNTKAEGKKSNLFSEFIEAVGDLLFEQLERWAKRFNKETPERSTITGILEDVLAWTEELIDQNNKLAYIGTNEEINAKYDAELKALEQQNVSNVGVEEGSGGVEENMKQFNLAKEGSIKRIKNSNDPQTIFSEINRLQEGKKATKGAEFTSEEQTIIDNKLKELKDKGYTFKTKKGEILRSGENIRVDDNQTLLKPNEVTNLEKELLKKELDRREKLKQDLIKNGYTEDEAVLESELNENETIDIVSKDLEVTVLKNGIQEKSGKVAIRFISVKDAELAALEETSGVSGSALKDVVPVFHHTKVDVKDFDFGNFQRGKNQVSQFGDGLAVSTDTTPFLQKRYGNPIKGEVKDSDFVVIDTNKTEKEIYEELKSKGYKFNKPDGGSYIGNDPAKEYDGTEKANEQPAIISLFNDFQKSNPEVKGVKIVNHIIANEKVSPFYVIYDNKSFYGEGSLKAPTQYTEAAGGSALKDVEGKKTDIERRKQENDNLGKSILQKLGYKNQNRLPNGNVKGGQSGWKIRFNIKNPKTGESYYDGKGTATLLNNDYDKRAETLINFLLGYFGSNEKADSKNLQKHYVLEDENGTKREPFKHLSGGEIGESDFTIYIGSADDVMKFISDIRTKHPEILELLHAGNKADDVKVDDIFKGRIEGRKIGFSGYHAPSNLNKVIGSDSFTFNFNSNRVNINYAGNSLSDITIIIEGSTKGYRGVFDENLKKDYPELYKNIRNIIGFQLYGDYLQGTNNEFLKFTGVDKINAKYDAELNKLESEKSTQKPTGPELVAKRSIRRAELKKEGKTVQEVNAILDEEFPLDSFESLLDSFEPGNTIGNLERLQSQIDKINSQSDKALNQEVKLVLNTVSAIAKEKTAQKDMSPLTREDVASVFTSIAENQPHLIDRIVAGVNGSLGLVTVPSIATVANTQTIEPVVSTKEIEEEAKEKLLDNSGFKITTGFTAATKIVATDSRDNPLFENGKIKFENNEYTKDYIKMHTNAVQIGDVWTIELKNDIDEDTPLDDLELELVYTNPETNETESRGFVHKEAYITEDNTTLTGEELQKEKERIRAIRQFYKDGGSGKQVKVIETTLAKPEFNQRTEIANLDGISVEMMQNVVVYSNGKFITKDGAEFKKSIPDVEDLKSGMVYFMAPQATHVGNEMTHLPILLIKKTFRSYGKINQTLSEIREAIKKELTGVLEGKKLPKGNTTEKFLFIDSSNKDSDAYRIKIKGNTIEYAGGFIAKTKDDLDKVLDDTIFNFNAKGDKAYRDQVQKAGLLVSNLATLESEGTTLYAFQPTYIFQEISPENPATITSETKIEETTPIVETQESNLAEVQEELKKKGVVLDWEVNEGLDSLEVIPEKQGSEIISLVDDENIVNSLAFQVIQDTRLDPGAKTTIDSLKPKFEEIVELLKSVKGSDKIVQRAQEHIEKYQDVLNRFDEFKVKAEEKLESMNFTKNKQGFYEDIVDQEDSPSQYQDESSYLENRLDSMPAMVRKLMSYISDYDSNGKIKRNILGLPTYVPVDIISNNVFEILTPHVYVNSKASLDKMIDLLGQSQNPTVKELHQILSTTKNNQLKQQFYKVFSIERDKPESFVFTDKDGKVKLRKNASDNSSGEAIIREEWVKAMESNTSMSSLDKEFIAKIVSNFSEFLNKPGNFEKGKINKATSQGVEELVSILNSLELAVDKPAIYSWLIGDKNVSGKRNDKEHIRTQIGTYIIRELESAKTLEDFITSTSGKLSSLSHHTAITSNRMIGGTYRVDGNTYNVHANSKPMTEKLHWINSIWDDLQEHPVYKYLYSRLNEMKVITDRGFRENKKGTRPKMMKDSNEGEFELMRILQFQEFGQLKTETHSDKATNFTVTGSTANNIKILDQKEDGKYEVSSEIVNALYNYFDMEVAKIQTYKARMANSALLKLKGVDSTPNVKGAGEYFMYNDSLNAEILAESNNPLDKKILNELYDKNKEGVYRLKDNINLSPEVVSAIRSKLKERFRSIVGETMTSWKKFGVFESEGSDVTKINFMDEKYKDKLTKDYSHLKDKAQLTTVMQHAYTDYSLNYVQSLLETNFIFGDPAQQSKIKVSENSLTAAQVLKGIKETFVNVSKRNARLLAQGGRAAWRKTSYKTQLFNDLDTDSQNVTQYLEEVQKAYKNDKNNELMTDAQEFTTVLEHLEDRLENGEINFTEFEGGMLMFDPEHYKEMLKNPDFMNHYPQASFRPIEINERMTLNSMGLLQPRKPVQVYSKMEGGIIQEYYIKTSSVPIIPALVKDKPFEKVLELMKKNDVQRMTFNSAVKIGQSGVQNLFNEDGSVNEEGFSTPMTLDRSGYHIQLNVPYDEDKHAIRQGSQVLKLLFVDLPEFVVVNGKKVANELRPGVTVQSLKKKYVELQRKMVKEGQAALLEEILSKADISIEGNNYVVRDATKLSEMLIEAGKDRDFIENSLKMLKVDESGNMIFPLSFNPNVDKIQPMLNALITNAVMRQKIEGKSYVQVSEVMLYDKRTVKEVEDLTEEQKGGIVYTKPEYKGLKKLGFVVKGKDGAQTQMAQVYAPFFFKDQNGKKISVSKFVTDGVLDLTRVPEDLLVINGFRIPTEGPKSMMMFEVVGFLPDSMGDTLIVPSEIAVQMGSDYDVDKLYTYNYEVDLNSIADGEVNRAVLSKRKESNSNELIDIHKEVLLSPQMFDALTTPQGFDNLLQSVEEIEDLLEKKGVSMEKEWLGMYDPNYQRRVFFDNLAGKSGTALSANANTFHALAQDADLYIGGTGFLFKNENGEYYDDSNVTENRVNEYDPNSYPKEKISSKNVWRLGKVLTFEGKSISNAISEWLGASVDNAKAKLLGRAGINDHNLAVGLSLVQAGFDNPLILSFINQPILKDYYDAMDNAKSMFNSKFETEKIEKAIKEVYKKYAPEKALNNLMLKDLEGFTLSEYQDMLGLSSKTVSQEQGLKQVAVLRAFLHYKGIADNIRNVQSSFVLDSKGLPKNHLEVLELVNRQDLIGGSLIKNIRNLENTVVGPYINIPRFTQKLFSDIYYYGKPAYSSLISEMKLALGKTDLLTDELNDIYNGIYSFVYSIPQIQDKVADGRNVEEYKKDLIQNLAPTIQRMKKLHPDNNLLRRVTISDGVPIIGNNFTTSDALEHQTTLSWLDMIKSDQKDLELKQLGLDLAAFTMYYNNSLFGVSNFMKYVPFEYFQSIGLSKSLQDLGKSLEEPEYLENFTKQYFQHNPKLAKSISIDFDKYKKVEVKIGKSKIVTDVKLNKETQALEVTADFGSEFRPATYFPFVKNYNKLTQQYDLYELVGENTESIHYKLISHLGNEGTTISEYNFNNSNQESNLKSNLDMYQRSNIVMQVSSSDTTIYSRLGTKTKSENVILKSWGELKDALRAITPQGIVSTRIKMSNAHFGNPFTSDVRFQDLIQTKSTKESVERYINWILTGETGEYIFTGVQPEELDNQREWILEKLISGELKGKPIFYYKELGEPSHATALDYLINNYNWKNTSMVTPETIVKKGVFTVNPVQKADEKATVKASIATQFIGFGEGITNSSTELYRKQAGKFANTGNYLPKDMIFVSIPGKRGDATIRKTQQDRTIREALKAIEAGATLITDNKSYVGVSDIKFEEEQSNGYIERTKKNASADATIDFGLNQKGESWTKKAVDSNNKKYIGINTNNLVTTQEMVNEIVNSLNSVNAKSLNIAGMGIYNMKQHTQEQVDDFVYNLLNQVLNSPNLKTKIESIRTGGQTGFDEAGAKASEKLGIKTLVLAPKGYVFRNKEGKDISNKEQFISRFEKDTYNEGEKRLAKNLEAKGYAYSEQTIEGKIIGVWKNPSIVTPETKVVPETTEKVDSVKDSILTKNGKLITDPKSLLANIQLQGSEYYRALAKHISENLGTVTIETGKLKEGRPANYFKGVITLDLDQLKDKSVVDIQRIVLHEFDHALTASKLKDPEFQQTPEYVELTDMHQAYKNTFSKEEKVEAEEFWKAYESGKPTNSKNHYLYYAYGSLDEFVTGVRTSPQVQQYMAGKLGVGKAKSIVNRIIQILKDAFKIEGNSLLEEAYDAILGVVEYNKPVVETVESDVDTFQYYGKNYKIVLKDGIGIDVSNYLGKESKKRVLLNYYNTNPDVDPQNGNKFRNKVERQPEVKSTAPTGKLSEYELFPGVFANEGQRDALDTIKKFLKSSSDEFLLKGRGGTGKTTIINKALEGSTPSQVIGATVSDEARGILQENMQKYTTVTTASLLGLVPDYKVTTGELYFRERDSQEELDFQGKGGTDPIEGKKIIIIDESSMIGEDLYELIMKKKDKDAKVIFMGDNAQIPPIPKDGSSEKDSPVFKLEKSKDNFRELTERMRQGKESPILPITDVYAENIEDIQEGKEGLDNPLNKRVSDISQGKGVDFIIDRESFLNEFVKDLKKSEDLKETIIVAAKNKTVDALNQAVREKLFTNAKEEPFIIGDRIRVNSPYVVNKKILYPNGFKVSVKGVEKTKSSKLNVPIYKIKVIVQQYNEYTGEIELKEKFLTTVDPKDKEELKKSLNKLAIEAKKYPKRSPESAQAWKEFYDFKALFVDLGYNYAVTAHKVQGSTYNSTYVVEQDIMNFPGSRLQRNRMMYTAISRPRFKLVIYNPTQEVSVSLDSFELPSKVIDTLRKMNSKQLEIFRKMKSDGIFTTKC